jgi:hypothetical protein
MGRPRKNKNISGEVCTTDARDEEDVMKAKKKAEIQRIYDVNPELLRIKHQLLMNRGEVVIEGERFAFYGRSIGKKVAAYKVDWDHIVSRKLTKKTK